MPITINQKGREQARRKIALQNLQTKCSVEVLEKLSQVADNSKALKLFEKAKAEKLIGLASNPLASSFLK